MASIHFVTILFYGILIRGCIYMSIVYYDKQSSVIKTHFPYVCIYLANSLNGWKIRVDFNAKIQNMKTTCDAQNI